MAAPTIEQAFVMVDAEEPVLASFYARKAPGATPTQDVLVQWYYSSAAALVRTKKAQVEALERKRREQVRNFQDTKTWIR
eukprot:SAG31_NODE_450_length_15512_cov_5.788555_12_plen_80_part_00